MTLEGLWNRCGTKGSNYKSETDMRLRVLVVVLIVLMSFPLVALELEFTTYGYSFNNADFKNFDQEAYEQYKSVDYLNTDDRMSFLYSNIALGFHHRYKQSEFQIDIYRSGFWGSDNLEGRDEGGNPILYKNLNYIYYPNRDMSIQIGRFFYEIGNTQRDYFFSDRIDGVSINYRFTDEMSMNFEVDVMGIGQRPEGTRLWFGIEKDEETIEDFNGDVLSARAGGYFTWKNLRTFIYGLRYGATTEGGADIAESGNSTVNKADNDFLLLGGTRYSIDHNRYGTADITAAYSYGYDYQYEGDHPFNGFAVAANYEKYIDVWKLRSVSATAGYFHPSFASMKAQSMAGMLLWAYKSYFASPYAYFYHFRDYAKEDFGQTTVDRTVGKTFARIDTELKIRGFTVTLMSLFLWANAPWGLSMMGIENELNVVYFLDNIEIGGMAAIFFPGSYYEKAGENNTYIPQGTDPFYGFSLYSTYRMNWE